MGKSKSLWLDHEPTAKEVIAEFGKFRREDYKEVVFCGFGEPTEAFEVLKEVAAYVKKEWKCPIRINTNGQGSLINSRDIAPELSGLIDTVSISLNHPDPEKYQELVRSRFGAEGYKGMLAFAKECTKYVPHVVMTTVDTTITKEEEEYCRRICGDLGVTYRIRAWEA
jgi:TatD family-associated radical SAM protein